MDPLSLVGTQFAGMLLVVATLGILAVAAHAVTTAARYLERPIPPPPPEAEPLLKPLPLPPQPVEPDADESPGIRAAVIAAAISTVLSEPHIITSIELAGTEQWDLMRSAWSLEGRRNIYASHKLR